MDEQTPPPTEAVPKYAAPVGRRAFLGAVGLGLTSLLWGGKAMDLVSGATKVLPESVQAAVPVGGRFRIYAVNPPYPTFDPATWQLKIGGMVERPVAFSMADLQALPVAEQTSDFHCVTGWSVLGVRWKGVRFKDLLEAAGPLPTASALRFVSAEIPYEDSLTMQQLSLEDAMLAYELDGEPISREQGAPVRVVMPQMFAYKGVKWLSEIDVTDRVDDGYWQLRGYDRDAWIPNAEKS